MVESYPVKTPMLDIVTVGSGGGSIAWTDAYGKLKVGPQSAGADPGPICYRPRRHGADRHRCGDRSRPPADGADRRRDQARPRSRRAPPMSELGERFRMTAEEVAAGALEIAAANQVFGIRQVTTARGRDPAAFAMVAFGGAGGLFGTEVADFLGMRPRSSRRPIPAISAPSACTSRTCGATTSAPSSASSRRPIGGEILRHWHELAEGGMADIMAEGIPREKIAIRRLADVRYFGEGHEVQVEIPAELGDEDAIDAHVEGVPQGPRPHLRLPLRRASRTSSSSICASRPWASSIGRRSRRTRRRARRHSPSRRGHVYWRQTGLDRMPALPSDRARRRAGASPDRRSSRNTARPSSCRTAGPARPTPTATSSWRRAPRGGDAAQGLTDAPASSARSSSR